MQLQPAVAPRHWRDAANEGRQQGSACGAAPAPGVVDDGDSGAVGVGYHADADVQDSDHEG